MVRDVDPSTVRVLRHLHMPGLPGGLIGSAGVVLSGGHLVEVQCTVSG
jgi:hypothetical protein